MTSYMQTNFELPPARMQRPSAEKASERKPCPRRILRRHAARRRPPAAHVGAAVDRPGELALLRIPNLDLAVERRRRERAAVGAEGEGEHVGGVRQHVDRRLRRHKVPHAHTLVPRPRRQKGGAAGGGGGEGDGRDRRLVPRQALEQLRVLQIPHVRDERRRARAHELPGRVDRDAVELRGRRRDQRLEVAVPIVERADGAVDRRRDERAAVRTKARSVTGPVCWSKVTKQKPDCGDHSFTLASPPPEAIT